MNRGPLLDRSLGSLLRGAVRGKCRHGGGHESCTLTEQGWWGEDGSGYECALAPEVTCRMCERAGTVEVRVPRPDGTEEVVRRPCLPCEGRGTVPGPHWPWRHRPPNEEAP